MRLSMSQCDRPLALSGNSPQILSMSTWLNVPSVVGGDVGAGVGHELGEDAGGLGGPVAGDEPFR